MPMQPVDAMWAPPTVGDALGKSNIMFKTSFKNVNKPVENERKNTISESEPLTDREPTTPVAIPRTRHFSISETFGSPLVNAFSNWAASPRQRSVSVCENDNFKELLHKMDK